MNQKGRIKLTYLQISDRTTFVFLIFLTGLVWFVHYYTHTKEIAGSDDREYASIARNIVNGKGIVRNFIYPVDINFFDKVPVPDYMHPPGYPLIIAGFFKLFGVSEFAALLPSYLSYFLLVILFFFFSKKYIGYRTTIVACTILVFNKEILNASLVVLSEAVFTLALFLFFIVFVQARSLKSLFSAGVLLGISHLIRENIYPFLIPLLVYLYNYPDLPRWKKMIFFIMGMMIPLVPNVARTFIDTRTFFFSYGKFTLMAFTEKYPWLSVYRGIENLSLIEFLAETPGQFLQKYFTNLVHTFEKVMSITNPYVLTFFLVEMFHWKIDAFGKRFKLLFLIFLISQIFFISLFTFTDRYFIPFLPFIIFLASQGFLRISANMVLELSNQRKKKILLFLLGFLFFIFPSVSAFLNTARNYFSGHKTPQFGYIIPRTEAEGVISFLNQELEKSKVIWTDFPEILEWEGDRLCGWLPTNIQSIGEIHKKIPVDAIFLTNIRTPYKMEEEWKYLLFTEHSLPKFRTVKLYRSGSLFAKLLIRDEED